MDVHTISLFSGIGMLDIGVGIALEYLGHGHRTLVYCEREAYASAVLLARMEEKTLEPAAICDSLEDIDGRWRGAVSGIVAGFPCQPFSLAGSRKGTGDERWLWSHIVRIIRDVGPRWVFLENVPGLLSGDGRAFGAILDSLAKMGFDAEWLHLKASIVGASHKRERWFCLAYRHERTVAYPEKFTERPVCGRPEDLLHQDGRCWEGGEVTRQLGGGCSDVEDTPSIGSDSRWPECEGQQRGTSSEQRSGDVGDTKRPKSGAGIEQVTSSEKRRNRPTESGHSNDGLFAPGPGDFDGWGRVVEDGSFDFLSPAIKPGVRVLVDGISLVVDASRADQLRCTGNAVVAIQAAAAFVELSRRIACTESSGTTEVNSGS